MAFSHVINDMTDDTVIFVKQDDWTQNDDIVLVFKSKRWLHSKHVAYDQCSNIDIHICYPSTENESIPSSVCSFRWCCLCTRSRRRTR
jgi:hypothetical protein